MDAARSALFINPGILGQGTFAEFVRPFPRQTTACASLRLMRRVPSIVSIVTPTVEWTQAVSARYGELAGGGTLCPAHVIDVGRLRAWMRRARPGIRRAFLLYKLTLLELWCRIVLGGG